MMQAEARAGDLLRVLRRSYLMITTIMVVGTILICTGPFLMPPKYTGKSQILIEPQGLMASQGMVVELPADEAAMQTEIAAITSPDLLQRVLDSLPTDRAFQAAVAGPPVKSGPAEGDFWQQVKNWVPRDWLTATGEPGPLSVVQLLRHLKVIQESGSHVITIGVTSINAQEAAAVANRLALLYVQSQDQQKRASTDRTLGWLAMRATELKEEVKQRDAAVTAYRVAHNLVGTNPSAANDGQIDGLSRQLAAAETDASMAQTRADIAQRALQKSGGAGAIAWMVNSPALTALHEQEIKLLQSLATANRAFAAGSPVMTKMQGEITEVRRQMDEEANRAAATLQQEADIAAAREEAIRQQLMKRRDNRADLALAELERDAAASHRLQEAILTRREQLTEQRESLSPGLRVLSLAAPPVRPSSVNPILFIPPAMILSFIFASFLAIVKASSDRTLRSENDIKDILGLRCVGLVPEVRRLRGVKLHQNLLSERFSPYAEAIRSVVAALRITSVSQEAKILLFTSSVPGEGKTSLAVSVAVQLAALGRRVVVVDLDLRRPAIVRELGGKMDGDLQDVINQSGSIANSVQRVMGLPLDFLAASRGTPTEPLGLFASDNVYRLLQNLRGKYDYIVIDSAPLLASAEARLLVSLADKILFVVRWGETRREVALNALSLLPQYLLDVVDGDEKVSAIVSRVDLKRHARYNYGDAGECLVEYGNYFSDTRKMISG